MGDAGVEGEERIKQGISMHQTKISKSEKWAWMDSCDVCKTAWF